MTHRFLASILALVFLLATGSILRAQASNADKILNTPHNLSTSGLGNVKANAESEVCIFCHTPHNSAPVQPLWNRGTPSAAYRVYSSRALDALPGQPTGTSKLCLSCHDGTIAVGSVLSRSTAIEMSGGMTTLPAGKSNLGTDLSDDHPISFRYDSTLVAKDPKLTDPSLLPATVKLDSNSELQCSSCHEAHDNSKGKFLVMDNSGSQLCNSCHKTGTTTVTNHINCNSCHQSHTAPSGPYLLKVSTRSGTCLNCHNGGTGTQGPNILGDVNKTSNHETYAPIDPVAASTSDTWCTDCHQPHTMKTGTAVAPNKKPNFGDIKGVNAAGSPIANATYEYEVCFRCHAEGATIQPRVTRQIVQNNTRLEFATNAVSYHPVEAIGKNTDVPTLISPWTTTSLMYCSDCHTSNTSKKAGGTGPNGVHGSNVTSLLLANYTTTDNTTESATAYALCYKCHNRTAIISSSGSAFRYHKLHVVDKKSPCSACHDSHGISSTQGTTTKNSGLINFDTRIVTANSAGKLEYNDTGTRHGRCYLRCHGENHNPESY